MSTLIRPAFHALAMLCVACTCMVAAQAVNSVVDAWLQPLPSLEEPPRKARAQEEIPLPLALGPLARILGLPDKLREEVIAAPGDESDEAVPNTLGLKLLGTMVGANSSNTFASVYDGTAGRTRSVWMGGDILGAQVVAIERTRVLLMNSGRLEYVSPTATDALPPPVAPRAATAPAATEPKSGVEVRQVGPQSYEVSRRDLDVALANPSELLMQARVIPAMRNGESQGFKLFSIRPGSLYGRIGLQNGDILQRINGLSIASAERGLEAFQKLRESSHIELEVERNGQPMRLTYSMR
ncbi:general secretion pathway protein C [Archangium gephyra]|uniref:General secretion pathway protein C n=1 Tax=Archangium gephyra TaxID=48 RepID=A0AAC8QF38_9BACT|nr:type II secretion system protein GspC [Archangium gephyra]AKJ06592.1 General secretion pathway protein C [Archangium gephyra]REG32097.1 general secretion pathway protein C [Archangium gephyra]